MKVLDVKTNAQQAVWQYGGRRIYPQLFVRYSASAPADE